MSCEFLIMIRLFYLDIVFWKSFQIFYYACDSNMLEFWSESFKLKRRSQRESQRCMHFELLNKTNFVKKKTINSSEIYIGKRTFHDMQASLKHSKYELFVKSLFLLALRTMYHLQHFIVSIFTSSLTAKLN